MDPLLTSMGARLRARRIALELTQEGLAERTGMSVRFLVDVERGRANVSVHRLADLCAALDLSLEDLFVGLGPGPAAGRRSVALVGLRGAGKSTVGAALAERLGRPFIELDRRVEEAAGMSLAAIFELSGEAHYRALEAAALEATLAEPGPVVIATGGSLVTSAPSWARLRAAALTVWLRASPAAHLERVRAQGDLRPMAGRRDALAELEAILAERSPLYAQAALALDTEALGLAGVLDALAGPAPSLEARAAAAR